MVGISNLNKKQSGFTLIEILLVVAALAILAGIVVLAINPNKQLGDTRNSERSTSVSTILNAVYQYALDNNGSLPPSVAALTADTPTEICATGAAVCTSLVDLGVLTASEKYLVTIPSDPQCPTACATNGAGFQISRTANNRVKVIAPDAEQGVTIEVTR